MRTSFDYYGVGNHFSTTGFKCGDLVVCINPSNGFLEYGKIYQVVNPDGGGDDISVIDIKLDLSKLDYHSEVSKLLIGGYEPYWNSKRFISLEKWRDDRIEKIFN